MADTKAEGPLNLAVVLGDPTLPYPYTESGRFGAEELEAVEHFHAALLASTSTRSTGSTTTTR